MSLSPGFSIEKKSVYLEILTVWQNTESTLVFVSPSELCTQLLSLHTVKEFCESKHMSCDRNRSLLMNTKFHSIKVRCWRERKTWEKVL